MKSAVKWLDEQIKEKMGLDEHDTNQLKWFIDKALEIEKEQIIKCYKAALYNPYYIDGVEYYNKNYNQKYQSK
jgi:hypothetical protein